MVRSQRLRDGIEALGIARYEITDLRNGFTEVRWVSAQVGNRTYYRSVCARSIGGMLASLERALRA